MFADGGNIWVEMCAGDPNLAVWLLSSVIYSGTFPVNRSYHTYKWLDYALDWVATSKGVFYALNDYSIVYK